MYWLCYCVASCNRYLMLINHPTDGATRGLTLRVRLVGRNLKKDSKKKLLAGKFVKRKSCSLIRLNTVVLLLSGQWSQREYLRQLYAQAVNHDGN